MADGNPDESVSKALHFEEEAAPVAADGASLSLKSRVSCGECAPGGAVSKCAMAVLAPSPLLEAEQN